MPRNAGFIKKNNNHVNLRFVLNNLLCNIVSHKQTIQRVSSLMDMLFSPGECQKGIHTVDLVGMICL